MLTDEELDAIEKYAETNTDAAPVDYTARLVAEVRSLRTALRYIAQPTMGYNRNVANLGPEEFIRQGFCSVPNMRLALATCVGMATAALNPVVGNER